MGEWPAARSVPPELASRRRAAVVAVEMTVPRHERDISDPTPIPLWKWGTGSNLDPHPAGPMPGPGSLGHDEAAGSLAFVLSSYSNEPLPADVVVQTPADDPDSP
jgi:hypothetical protein